MDQVSPRTAQVQNMMKAMMQPLIEEQTKLAKTVGDLSNKVDQLADIIRDSNMEANQRMDKFIDLQTKVTNKQISIFNAGKPVLEQITPIESPKSSLDSQGSLGKLGVHDFSKLKLKEETKKQ